MAPFQNKDVYRNCICSKVTANKRTNLNAALSYKNPEYTYICYHSRPSYRSFASYGGHTYRYPFLPAVSRQKQATLPLFLSFDILQALLQTHKTKLWHITHHQALSYSFNMFLSKWGLVIKVMAMRWASVWLCEFAPLAMKLVRYANPDFSSQS